MKTQNLSDAFQAYADHDILFHAIVILGAILGATVVIVGIIAYQHKALYKAEVPDYITSGMLGIAGGAIVGMVAGTLVLHFTVWTGLEAALEENIHQNLDVKILNIGAIDDDMVTFDYREEGQATMHTVEARYIPDHDVIVPVVDDMTALPIREDSALAQYIDTTE